MALTSGGPVHPYLVGQKLLQKSSEDFFAEDFRPKAEDLKPNAEYLNLKYLFLPCLKSIPHRSWRTTARQNLGSVWVRLVFVRLGFLSFEL